MLYTKGVLVLPTPIIIPSTMMDTPYSGSETATIRKILVPSVMTISLLENSPISSGAERKSAPPVTHIRQISTGRNIVVRVFIRLWSPAP